MEFRWKPIYTKVRIFFLPIFPPKKKTENWDPVPHNRPQKKKAAKSAEVCLAKKIWDFNVKFWTLEPTLPIGHGWHMWSGGTYLGDPSQTSGLGKGRYNHPLTWSCPMFFASLMERRFNFSIPLPLPLVNAQIHASSFKHVKTSYRKMVVIIGTSATFVIQERPTHTWT